MRFNQLIYEVPYWKHILTIFKVVLKINGMIGIKFSSEEVRACLAFLDFAHSSPSPGPYQIWSCQVRSAWTKNAIWLGLGGTGGMLP